MADREELIHVGRIESRIFFLRGQKVMLSTHLAELYQVEPRALVQAVKRNIERFPADFMLRLSAREFANLKSQLDTSRFSMGLTTSVEQRPRITIAAKPVPRTWRIDNSLDFNE